MGMESPETAVEADDSYRAAIAVGACVGRRRRAAFLLRSTAGKNMNTLIVFIGGGLGAALRHGVNVAVARLLGTGFNYATLFENVSGSLVMGLLVGYFALKGGASQHWRLFLTTGMLGGYTTFSAFSLDTVLLYERGELGLAALYVILSVVLSVGGLWVGLALMRHFA
jgi:fluoride exporter